MPRNLHALQVALRECTRDTGPMTGWKDRMFAIVTDIGVDLMSFDSAGDPFCCASGLVSHIRTHYGDGFIAKLDEAVAAIERTQKKESSEAKEIGGIIVRIGSRVIGGDSQYVVILDNLYQAKHRPDPRMDSTPRLVLTAAGAVSVLLPLAQAGDTVWVKYVEDKQGPVAGRIHEFSLRQDSRDGNVLPV